ncbi:Oidioi.mRNA.OKI2018_I69.chr2.g5677.t1.cds [Oikopleura dioica]|uniref:Leucine-rich repeat-containing protein 6 n=1 Tax=Oikopleura dioica TaxID=34765 RepID=A0ABN7T6P8_OIKDI|nr:Oidioi.mRNA.OKI2018_I69.chr2.g5677.t1.cds [Oikopleura dioica]
MVFITEELVRKRAEHNELEIGSLEELSLHQLDIEKIEHIDKWCKQLKILYLHSNIIFKIENVSRMKKLEYINLTLNCIEVIEGMEGCESLNKLDLTANFVGDMRHLKNLQKNEFLKTLYLTGNICCKYEYYREYVITILPQLKELDGEVITTSERLEAKRIFEKVENAIERQSELYLEIRERQKFDYERKAKTTGDEFWNEEDEDSPENRRDMRIEATRQKEENKDHKPMFEKPDYKREIRYFAKDGRPLNVNPSGVEFTIDEDQPKNVELRLKIPKFMDTELIDIDSQPTYIRLSINGKPFQIVWKEEVKPDDGTAQRSKITGELLIKIPKLNPGKENPKEKKEASRKTLEPESQKEEKKTVDYRNIVKEAEQGKKEQLKKKEKPKTRANDDDFVDDLGIPPLETVKR